jgi:uncharacterized protein involved in exopolysaccharide biosynthesis
MNDANPGAPHPATKFGAGPLDDTVTLLDIVTPILESWKLVFFGSLLAGVIAVGCTYLMRPVFTARTVFVAPQQPQSSAASAIAALGNLTGLGASVGSRNSAEQYVALLQSTTVADRMIERFGLMQSYESELRSDARRVLGSRTRVSIGKKDGLITLEVDDHDPKVAAEMANRYVDELRELTSSLALTEAQQRRLFFEQQLQATRLRLSRAQADLQSSGFNPGALKSEPRAAAESYAQLRARVTEAEVRLRVLRQTLADSAPEVVQQTALLAALRQQLVRTELPAVDRQDADYIGRYREFKYQEALFDLFARQFESARIDESREGALIQVIDAAKPADRRTSPKRAVTGILTVAAAMFTLLVFVLLREAWRRTVEAQRDSRALHRLQTALGRPTTTR